MPQHPKVGLLARLDVGIDAFKHFGSSTSSDFGWVQRAGIQHMMLGGLSRPDRNVHGPDEYTTRADLLGLSRSVYCMLSAEFNPNYNIPTIPQGVY